MIAIKNVSKVYNAGKPNEFIAIKNFTVNIDYQKVTIIKGPSGSGKTTILGLIGCMVRPTSGRIYIGEKEITSLPERFLTQIRREKFGFIFQQFNLIRGLSAIENIMIPAYPTGIKYSYLYKKAMQIMEQLNIGHKADTRVEYLSGGEAQRIAISRALINDSKIIIADEPTAHLDSKLSNEFMSIVANLKNDGKTIIMSSHDPIVYKSILADRIINLSDGRIIVSEKQAIV